MVRYAHRQTSYRAMVLFFPTVAAVGVAIWLAASATRAPPLFIPVTIITLVALIIRVFSTLIIEVTDRDIAFGFLFGAMRRRIPFTDIVRAECSTIAWWHGTGVKYGWKTTNYLVWPGPAVALTLTSGRTIRIGTDDPDALFAALQR